MSTKLAASAMRTFTLLFVLLFSETSHAVQQIEWRALLPQLPPLEDPLSHLAFDQRYEFGIVAWARSLDGEEKRLTATLDKYSLGEAAEYERKLKRAGHNIEELLTKYQDWRMAKLEREKLINTSLSDQNIKMAGYLLPLKFSEEGETEFLLVPYVGACVHTPPPPPNQIIFVQLAQKISVEELYTPVWVTGQLQTKSSSRAIKFGDGSRSVDVGYYIEKGSVEVYKQN